MTDDEVHNVVSEATVDFAPPSAHGFGVLRLLPQAKEIGLLPRGFQEEAFFLLHRAVTEEADWKVAVALHRNAKELP